VSKESHAEKLGICIGDIIERFNGECVSTTVEVGAYINKFQIKWNDIIYLYCTSSS
jgi:S1-C subfamily serine protease